MSAPGLPVWQARLLKELAERFPRSSQASGGRELRLRVDSAFPDLDRRRPDDYESFLEAAEALEQAGLVSLVWQGHRKGEELQALVLRQPGQLFARLGRASPQDSLDRSLASARAAADAGPFFAWLAQNLTVKDLDPVSGEPGAATIRDAARLARTLEQIARGQVPPRLPRALSVELFANSKRIEALLQALQPSLKRAERSDIPLPPYELADRSFPQTWVAGVLEFFAAGRLQLANPAGLPLGLSFATVAALSAVRSPNSQAGRLLGVENKESFFDLARRIGPNGQGTLPFDALVYVGGHPNRAVQALFRRLAQDGWELYHSGDLDPDGILILQELSDACERPVLPWMMDKAVWERYRSQGQAIGPEAHHRALLIREDTRRRSGIDQLLEAILNEGIWVEQEIIGYD